MAVEIYTDKVYTFVVWLVMPFHSKYVSARRLKWVKSFYDVYLQPQICVEPSESYECLWKCVTIGNVLII